MLLRMYNKTKQFIKIIQTGILLLIFIYLQTVKTTEFQFYKVNQTTRKAIQKLKMEEKSSINYIICVLIFFNYEIKQHDCFTKPR